MLNSTSLSDIVLTLQDDHLTASADSYQSSNHDLNSLLSVPGKTLGHYEFSHGSILKITVLVTVRGTQSVQHQTTGAHRTP